MSREKQIEEMANDIAAMCPDLVNSGCGDLSCVACLARGLEQMSYRKQEWISVEERLPIGADGRDYAENVIAYTVDGMVATGWLLEDKWWLLYGNNDHHIAHGRGYVTHWMPLPEAP